MIKRVMRNTCRQLVRSVSLLLAVCVVSFTLIVSSPIDPVEAYLGPDKIVSEEHRQSIVEYWGLDKEPLERLEIWFTNLLHGDLGESITYRQPV